MSYGQSRPPGRSVTVTVLSTVLAALIAGVSVGGVLYDTGLLGTLTELYGTDGLVPDWALLFAHSVLAGGVFVGLLSIGTRGRYAPAPLVEAKRSPFLGVCLGIAYGTLLWLAVVAYGVPLWLEYVAGVAYPRPYRHLESFVALVWFGGVLGAWYPLMRVALGPGR